jgi:pilus assembly protein CpaF
LEALGIAAGLPRAAVHAQAVAALDAVVHLVRDRSGRRRVANIDLLSRSASGEMVVVPGLEISGDGEICRGSGATALDALVAEVGT